MQIFGLLKMVAGLVSGNSFLFFYCGLLKDTHKCFFFFDVVNFVGNYSAC